MSCKKDGCNCNCGSNKGLEIASNKKDSFGREDVKRIFNEFLVAHPGEDMSAELLSAIVTDIANNVATEDIIARNFK